MWWWAVLLRVRLQGPYPSSVVLVIHGTSVLSNPLFFGEKIHHVACMRSTEKVYPFLVTDSNLPGLVNSTPPTSAFFFDEFVVAVEPTLLPPYFQHVPAFPWILLFQSRTATSIRQQQHPGPLRETRPPARCAPNTAMLGGTPYLVRIRGQCGRCSRPLALMPVQAVSCVSLNSAGTCPLTGDTC